MYNAPQPKLEDLPTPSQLRRSTIIAAIGAVAIGVMVYLPAEYGTDPTGVGSILGLTEMGEIKQQLAAEAEADRLLDAAGDTSSVLDDVFGLFVSAAHAQEAWQDEIIFTLAPGESTEIKATMEQGATLTYDWVATGGRVNFDLHAHAGSDAVTYETGRGQTSGEGSFETPFAGDHGWFWRNRDDVELTVTLQLRGSYSEIVRSE
ncbi:transmembrane anchor protein [Pararhizobium antarcticum]|uniref:Transmembrane anchor protein n=1 Tax=Pararhizobium antarcticum TaxID=1798805 RepID=A0A657LVI1_9HYPH|nr:transmembrane anchor protein [Pararhizobium antarcticum]OJF99364.1 transmembrane anchor protein [Pararhizobium antarcticum]